MLHKPYVSDDVSMPEFTWSAVLVGSLLGIVFGASSLYLVLKVGMTVSASIPVSVLAITLFRAASRMIGVRRATILENNIVQTAGSAGESIAFGVGVTMPAVMLLGYSMDFSRTMVVALLGGLLGILAMIPLRRAFIVKMHGKPGEPGTLLYPEGTACAQVLMTGERGGSGGLIVFIGFGIAFLHKFLTEGLKAVKSTLELPLQLLGGAQRENPSAVFANEYASELLGVGYIIGRRTASIMMAGAVLGYLVIIPLIAYVGDYVDGPVPPGEKPISEMDTEGLRDNYLLFMGAGCVATAGIISMFRTLPMIVRSILAGLGTVTAAGRNVRESIGRTENDMSMRVVFLGSLGLLGLLVIFLAGEVGLLSALAGALLVVLFGFLFVTVSARLTGEIGSSSNPISGMTVATLTLTCLIFLALGWESSSMRLLALSIAAVVCVASSNGGTTAQSLKTGFLVGATPRMAQWAILIGSVTSALVIGGTLVAFNAVGTIHSSKSENLPAIVLSPAERGQLEEKETYDGRSYVVWDTHREMFGAIELDTTRQTQLAKVMKGRYLVDPETGKVAWLVDPGIMGQLKKTDDGQEVQRSFPAPKTQVMGIIINGVLQRKLNWALVVIGALIAVMLELCGISSLAFAVGVYVPIQYSTPIFIGGLIRSVVDGWAARRHAASMAEITDPEAKALAEVKAIRKAETSPGVLLASGFIAGGSIAGVLGGFLSFSDTLPTMLEQWRYRTVPVVQASSTNEQLHIAAEAELGPGDGKEYNDLVAKKVAELRTVNSKLLKDYEKKPVLPSSITVEVAGEKVEQPVRLNLPQWESPALMGFMLLVGLLLFIGLRPPPDEKDDDNPV